MNSEDFQQNHEHGGYPIVVALEGNVFTRFFRWLRRRLALQPQGDIPGTAKEGRQ